MNLKDIANRNVANLANCESEPIHIPGSIQPHGVLLGLDPSGIIRYCSANGADAFGVPPAALLRKHLSAIDPALATSVAAALEPDAPRDRPFRYGAQERQWDVFAGRTDDGATVLELEAFVPATETDESLFDRTRDFVRHIERSRSLQELCHRIAGEVRAITGYDRVMIYRFDNEYNGQVYVESRHLDLEPFLDLHYPHTDIPVQARELYLRNLMRMIADVHYTPVPLLAVEGDGHNLLDLSDSVLRSVSPIHIQYLKNMNVGATLTISLVLEGRLWGLIACHHRTALHLNHRQRKAALMQGHFLTSQIKVRQVSEEYEVYTVVEAHLQQLLNALPQEGDFGLRMQHFSSLLAVANASGAVVLHKGQIYEKGLVPPRDRVKALLQWLAVHSSGQQFATAHLLAHYPDAARIAREASGILYYKLGDPARDAILWFREERERTIRWAGNPHDAVKRSPVTNQLTPRSSFEHFKEHVRSHSLEWRVSEVNAAGRFAGALQNHFHVEYLRAEDAAQRVLNEKLVKANNELANINWITTHDLKEPIRKIQLFASRVMGEEEQQLSESIIRFVGKIQDSAQRMRILVDDIMTYSLSGESNAPMEHAPLDELLADVVKSYHEELAEKGGQVIASPLAVLPVIPYQVRQLFNNLIGNSVKFAHADRPLEIRIDSSAVEGSKEQPLLEPGRRYFRIRYRDNGIGFDPAFSGRIFNIFYRLHDKTAYTGTGIGLAICKRIVENHGGTITASGSEGAGAEFEILLPAEE